MEQVFLSDVELYYVSSPIEKEKLLLEGEEVHHIKNVMRHTIGDVVYVTDGVGTIYETIIEQISKKTIECRLIQRREYQNPFNNIFFCIPRLKNQARFDFAIEKSVELGITNFIVYESSRTIAKGEKLDRWQKLLLSAMKQSLRAWLPKISYVKNIKSIFELEGTKILFDQNASQTFQSFLPILNSQFLASLDASRSGSILNCFFIFGPEGGLTNAELSLPAVAGIENLAYRLASLRSGQAGCELVKLTENRLRTETAIVTAASILSLSY